MVPNSNTVIYNGVITDSSELVKLLTTSKIMDKIISKLDGNDNSFIVSNICNKVEFVNEEDIDFSETQISIKIDELYQYRETYYITAIKHMK